MEMAVIVVLLLVIAAMGTIIVHMRRQAMRRRDQIEKLKQGMLDAINAMTNGGSIR